MADLNPETIGMLEKLQIPLNILEWIDGVKSSLSWLQQNAPTVLFALVIWVVIVYLVMQHFHLTRGGIVGMIMAMVVAGLSAALVLPLIVGVIGGM